MRNFKFLLLAIFSVLSLSLGAQERTVSGKVTDSSNGEPVSFAAIRVQGTMTGTSTDIDGNFSISAPSDAVLEFTSIGYKQVYVPLEGRTQINVVMSPDTETLEETIVVAFGTSTKEAFTGSAAVVKSADIAKVQSSDATRALEGMVAGVQMTTSTGSLGSSPSIVIRGIGTMNASSAPLYVVDGVPYTGDMNNLNSADIESITVQKDAASNSLYGSRGANGVIMITTKKAKWGDAVVNVDAKWGMNSRALRTYDVITDPGQYYEAFYASLYGYYTNQGKSESLSRIYANQDLSKQLGYISYTVADGGGLIGEDGRLNPTASLGATVVSPYDGQTYTIMPDNWLDNAYRKSLRQEYNISVSGSTGKMSMYASFGYLNNKGIIAGSDMQRYTARLRGDYQAKSWLKMGATFSFTNFNWNNGNSDEGSSNSSSNVFAIATSIAPIYPLYVRDAEGNFIYDDAGRRRYDYGYYENGCYRPFFTKANPVSDMQLNKNNFQGNAFNVIGYAEVSFLKDFKFTFNVGANVDETRTTNVYNKLYGQFASSGGVVSKGHGREFDLNMQQILSWNRKIAGLHEVSVMVGHEWQKQTNYSISASKSQIFSNDTDELDGAIIDNNTASSSRSMYNVEGYFARVQYDFNQKYFANLSYRLDASSNFNPKHRWGSFWAVGAGWLISKEDWFRAPWVDMLKIKASAGSQGNDGIGSFRYTDTYMLLNNQGTAGLGFNDKGNENITWETNMTVNVGADFDFFRGRLSGSVEYFYKKTSDMLYFFSLPSSIGYNGYYDNIGDMRNTGVEVDLHGVLMRRQNFNWDAYLNFTHYTNKVLLIPEKNKIGSVEGYPGFANGSKFVGEGLPFNTFYLKKYAGVDHETGLSMWYRDEYDDNGNVVGQTKTSTYEEASYYLCGNPVPALYGGFGTSLSFHGFDVALAFTYSVGGKAYDSGYASFMSSPTATSKGFNFHKDVFKAWTPDNKDSDIPRHYFGDQYTTAGSDRFLTDASWLNFQNAQVGYTIPERLTSRIKVSRLRIYLSCDNIFYVSRRRGFDPRFSFSGNTNSSVNSPVRTLSGGINITF
ncbi:MAG: SusC/RagA family TonB-linked outer membrane protein [Bacteroidales bacterium]|nr:SusC/RagA family TonB-linked outer membrane protein [Bacteroidales bacterium]